MWSSVVLLALAAHFCASSGDERPLVTTFLGPVEGVWMTSEMGTKYAAYLGVPFAQPPIGKLRFQEPQPATPWSGKWDASTIAPQCLSFDHRLHPMDNDKIKGHEDCLYLNIYTPSISENIANKKLLPVIVYIHAGAFMFGTSNQYGAKFIADRNILLVSINYRLGPLGFLSFGDELLPGNNGLKDQVEALRWVKKYILSFGGDPENITLMGLSAGGSSVHFHYLSPLSQGLFKRGISLSGTALSRWALAENMEEKSRQISANLGCSEGGSQEKLDCLRKRPAQNIVAQVEQFQVWQYSPFSPLGPVVEKNSKNAFLPDTPINLLNQGKFAQVPWITGVTKSEGLYPSGTFINKENELAKLDSEFDSLVPSLLHFNFTVADEDKKEVLLKIRKEYFGDDKIDRKAVPQIIKAISDRLFKVDAQRAAEIQAANSAAPVWFYHFTYRGAHSLSDLMTSTNINHGASHGDDISYVLNVTFIPHEVPRTGEEAEVQRQMLDLWSTFVEMGAPISPDVPWKRVEPGKPMKYLLIDTAPSSMMETEDLGNAKFWESLPFKESSQSNVHFGDYLRDEL